MGEKGFSKPARPTHEAKGVGDASSRVCVGAFRSSTTWRGGVTALAVRPPLAELRGASYQKDARCPPSSASAWPWPAWGLCGLCVSRSGPLGPGSCWSPAWHAWHLHKTHMLSLGPAQHRTITCQGRHEDPGLARCERAPRDAGRRGGWARTGVCQAGTKVPTDTCPRVHTARAHRHDGTQCIVTSTISVTHRC